MEHSSARAREASFELGVRSLIGIGAFALAGCGAAPELVQERQKEQVSTSEQFVVWLSTNDPLVPEHTRWHSGCDGSGQPSCSRLIKGQQFLTFHRDYLHRLRQRFWSLGRTENIKPWYRVPEEMKFTQFGWTASHAAAEQALLDNIDPATGQPFASLNAFGLFLEERLHNALHGIARQAFGEPAIGPANMSPTSTYFFKIHGYVEWLYQRYERGDWSKNGKSDILRRNLSTGVNSFASMTGNVVGAWSNSLPAVGLGGCNWHMAGGSGDFNFDGNPDLIWRGPDCGLTVVWHLNSNRQYIGESALPGAGTNWRIVGTGDFNEDVLPDILWQRDDGLLSFEFMDGPNVIGIQERQLQPHQYVAQVIDFDSFIGPDLLIRNLNTMAYSIQYMVGADLAAAGSRRTIVGGPADPFTTVIGAGRYHTGPGGHAADLLWLNDPPCGPCSLSVFVTPWSATSGAGAQQSVLSSPRGFSFTGMN